MAEQLGHEEKQLLHWLNSLPLAACLLVDSFAGLQNGDVLFNITTSLQPTSTKAHFPPSKASSTSIAANKIQYVLTTVLAHAPRNTRGYHLRDPESILDILDGHVPALCAVLNILKTLWTQKEVRLNQKQYIQDQVQKLHAQPVKVQPASSTLTKQSTISYTPPQRLVPKAFKPPEQSWNSSTSVIHQKHQGSRMTAECHDKKPSPPTANRFRVKYMVDPLWISPSEFPSPAVKPSLPRRPSLEVESAYKVCDWIRSLGINLPFDELPQPFTAETFLERAGRAFQDGVILCEIAAILAYRTGQPFIKSKLRPLIDRPGCFVPQGCTISPQNAAQKRHNVQLALGIITMKIPSELSHLDDPSSFHFIPELWQFLYSLRKETIRKYLHERKRKQNGKNSQEKTSKEDRLPCITHEQTERVREWLHSLQLTPLKQPDGLLQDPLRNGSLLCQLVNQITPSSRPIHYHQAPSSLHQAKENLFQALSVLRSLQLRDVPPTYVASSEPFLKGSFQIIWGLLYHLMLIYHEKSLHTPMELATPSSDQKSYTDEKVLLTHWLQTERFLDSLKFPHANPTFDDIQKYMQNGVLLVLLTDRVTGVNTLKQVHQHTSRKSALELIEGALQRLREVPNMPQRYLWCDEKIYGGHLNVIVGLLQDIRQVYHIIESKAVAFVPAPVRSPGDEIRLVSNEPDMKNPAIQSLSSDEEVAKGEHDLLKCWHVNTEVNSSNQWRETDINPEEDLFPQPHTCDPTTSDTRSSRNYLHVDDDVVPLPCEYKTEATEDELQNWLKQLHIMVSLEEDTLIAFKDGLILVDLIEKVAHLRRLEGICRNPQEKRANCLHNIRKVFEILSQNKTMPLNLLRREKDVYAGHRHVILPLLDQIRRAYGHHRGKHP